MRPELLLPESPEDTNPPSEFIECGPRALEISYPSVVEGAAGPPDDAGVAGAVVAFAADLDSALVVLSEYGRSGACGFAITTVEIACLKISCSWLFVSSTTEYLSNERMRPVSFTPLSRYNVMIALSLRAVFKKESWMFCAGLLSTADLLVFGNFTDSSARLLVLAIVHSIAIQPPKILVPAHTCAAQPTPAG